MPFVQSIILLSMILFIGAAYFIISHGVDYVAWPRLNPLDDVIHYKGKGYSSGNKGRGLFSQRGALNGNVPIHKNKKESVTEIELGHRKRVD